MLLSPRSRRSGDIESGASIEQDFSSRQRSQIISPRSNSSNSNNVTSRHAQSAFFLSSSPPPTNWQRRVWLSSIVPVLATACLCTVVFCLLHVYLTGQMDSTAASFMQPITAYQQHSQHVTQQSTSKRSSVAARQQHILAAVDSCLRQHPSYSHYTDGSPPANYHTPPRSTLPSSACQLCGQPQSVCARPLPGSVHSAHTSHARIRS